MDCPRCGGTLTVYRLAETETVACEDCAYVGVPVDHTSAAERAESWTEALSRFYEQHRSDTPVDEVVTREGVPRPDAVRPVFEDASASAAEAAAPERGSKESETQQADPGD